VVALQQLRAPDVATEHHAAEEPEAVLLGGLLVDARDGLDLRVVGRDARAHEAERRRERVEDVDLEPGLEQLVGGVEPGGPGADDHGAQRLGGGGVRGDLGHQRQIQ